MVQSKATPVYEGLTRGQVADSERLAAKVRDPYQNAMANVPKSEPYRPSSSSKASSGGGLLRESLEYCKESHSVLTFLILDRSDSIWHSDFLLI